MLFEILRSLSCDLSNKPVIPKHFLYFLHDSSEIFLENFFAMLCHNGEIENKNLLIRALSRVVSHKPSLEKFLLWT